MSGSELFWLPPRPLTWAESLSELDTVSPGADPAASWHALVRLANHHLDGLATIRLDRRLQRLFGQEAPTCAAGVPIRLAVLGSATTDHLLPAIRVAALRRGLWLTTYAGEYGQYRQEVLEPAPALAAFQPTAVLFALDAHHATARFDVADSAADAGGKVAGLLDDLSRLWRAVHDHWGCAVLQQALLPLLPTLFGSNEHRLPGSGAAAAAALNAGLRLRADAAGADIVAVDDQVAQDGLAAWHDPLLWHRAKQEVRPSAVPAYGELVARLLTARQGRAAKCLVLDLDNTLWGGVVGDDGLDGLKLGQGSAAGEAFVDFQRYAKGLSRRGIILAVCSKNDEANALEVFDNHPDMVLRRADIACFAVNWQDKAANLRDIAARLSIGLDALVFADDNPFEREIVRRELPMVTVPELPEDPALYARCIAASGAFEGVRLTAEDFGRSQQYQANARRQSLEASSTDLEGYLRSLDMKLHWRRFDAVGRARITQLINKTNQFNLTTRRTTEEEVSALVADEGALTLQLRLLDAFGDNGVIAIVAGRPGADRTLELETWLMSCRVLGRRVEEATLNLVMGEAARLGAETVIGTYRPTAKNGMVRDHYRRLGFAPDGEAADGATRWTLAVAGYTPAPTFIDFFKD